MTDAPHLAIDPFSEGFPAAPIGCHDAMRDAGPVSWLARLVGELVLNALLRRVTTIRLTDAPVRRLNNTLHALAHLSVEAEAL